MKKPTAKFFQGKDYEDIVRLATNYFNLSKEMLHIQIYSQNQDDWVGLARIKSIDKKYNASWQLLFESDGVFLEIYPAKSNAHILDKPEVIKYINRKNITNHNGQAQKDVLNSPEGGRIKIAPAQREKVLDEDIEVVITKDEMNARARLLPPDEGGKTLDMQSIVEKIISKKVVKGILQQNLEKMLQQHNYNIAYNIAKGKEVKHGENGYIEYHFSTEKRDATPKQDETGKVDWRVLDLFTPVKKDQLLVTRHFATNGTEGYTVTGKTLAPKPGKQVALPRSRKATANQDKTQLFADVGGMVELIDEVIKVSDEYVVNGDCDMGVGNLDFEGNISITGNVITGLTVKAAGNITIGGVVGGASIIAGNNIEIKRGIQGVDRGRLNAGGWIKAQFLERATVVAQQTVTADMILHCNVQAGQSVYAQGRKGSIMGGSTRATKEIVARTLGTISHNKTYLEVGILSSKRNRLKLLEKEIPNTQQEIEKLKQIENYVNKVGDRIDQERKTQLELTVSTNMHHYTQLLEQNTQELNLLQQEIDSAVNGKIHVLGEVYPEVHITIAKAAVNINKTIEFATFRFEDGEITFSPCEYRR